MKFVIQQMSKAVNGSLNAVRNYYSCILLTIPCVNKYNGDGIYYFQIILKHITNPNYLHLILMRYPKIMKI